MIQTIIFAAVISGAFAAEPARSPESLDVLFEREMVYGQLRIVQVLTQRAETDPNAQEVLLRKLFSLKSDPLIDCLIQEAVAKASWAKPEAIWSTYENIWGTYGEDKLKGYSYDALRGLNFGRLCRVFAMMGKRASPVGARLDARLKDGTLRAFGIGELRVVLVEVSYHSDENAKAIWQAINARTEEGQAAISMIGVIAAPECLRSADVKLLADILEVKGDFPEWSYTTEGNMSIYSVIVLGLKGEQARAAIGPLKKLKKAADRDSNSSSMGVAYGMALASIDKKASEKYLNEVFRHLGSNWNHTDAGVLLESHRLMTSEVLVCAGTAVESSDPDIARGAMRFLCSATSKTAGQRKNVMKVLEKGKDESIREEAARTMTSIGTVDDIPNIERIMAKETSEDVRSALRGTLKALNFARTIQQSPTR